MGTNANARVYGRRSLLSVMLTAIAITVNHRYALGAGAFVLGAVLLAVPAALWCWLRRSQRRIALVGYLLMNAWIIVGFGLAKGFWQGALRLFLGTFLVVQVLREVAEEIVPAVIPRQATLHLILVLDTFQVYE